MKYRCAERTSICSLQTPPECHHVFLPANMQINQFSEMRSSFCYLIRLISKPNRPLPDSQLGRSANIPLLGWRWPVELRPDPCGSPGRANM